MTSKFHVKDLLYKSLKRKKTYKNPKKDVCLQKHKTEEPLLKRVQKPIKRNKSKTFKQINRPTKTPKQILPEKEEKKAEEEDKYKDYIRK